MHSGAGIRKPRHNPKRTNELIQRRVTLSTLDRVHGRGKIAWGLARPTARKVLLRYLLEEPGHPNARDRIINLRLRSKAEAAYVMSFERFMGESLKHACTWMRRADASEDRRKSRPGRGAPTIADVNSQWNVARSFHEKLLQFGRDRQVCARRHAYLEWMLRQYALFPHAEDHMAENTDRRLERALSLYSYAGDRRINEHAGDEHSV